MTGRFDNQVAVVTGGSSGIGLATATRLHREGAQVAIVGREKQRLNHAASLIGDNTLTVSADVSQPGDIDTMFAVVAQTLGPIDVLFVSAGRKRFQALGQATDRFFENVFDVSTKGAFFTIQKAIPHLKDGAAVIVCELAPIGPAWRRAGTVVYAAAQAATHAIICAAAAELWPRRIRVNTLMPTTIDSLNPQAALGRIEQLRHLADETSTRRLGSRDEIAHAVAFLASPDAANITGQRIPVPGRVI